MSEHFRAHRAESAVFKGQTEEDLQQALSTFDRITSEIRKRIQGGEEVHMTTQTGFTIYENSTEVKPGERPFCFVRTHNDMFSFGFPNERIEEPREESGELPS